MLNNKQKIYLHRLYRTFVFNFPASGVPSIFIVGAQKSGTTSLHEYICKHPTIKSGLLKEIHFFDNVARYSKGVKWYELHFKNFNLFKSPKFVDATPEYMTSDVAMRRLHQYNPKAKIIVILREPVSRAYSAWNFYAKLPRYKKKIYEFLPLIQDEIGHINTSSPFSLASLGIVRYGCYSEQLAALFHFFPKEQIMILGSTDLKQRSHEVLSKVFRFVDVAPYDPNKCISRRRNKGAYTEIPAEAQDILNDFYAPYNEALFRLLGFRPEW